MTNTLPKTLIEAVRYFSDLEICHAYMRKIKWPDGKVVCPTCGNESCSDITTRPGKLKCNRSSCQRQFTPWDGTIFHNRHAPLGVWLSAVWAVANREDIGGPAFAELTGVTIKTAWDILRQVREAESMLLLPGEEWRGVAGYEGLYEVSNHARIRTLARIRRSRSGRKARVSQRLIEPSKLPSPHDHWTITLSDDGVRKSHPLHVIVATAFHGACPPGKQCRHVDGNPNNNHADNLKWGTPLENAADRDRHGRTARGERNAAATLTEQQVREIKSHPRGYGTGKKLAAEFGVSESIISQIRTGKTWGHL